LREISGDLHLNQEKAIGIFAAALFRLDGLYA
jgi:hypothetical protein